MHSTTRSAVPAQKNSLASETLSGIRFDLLTEHDVVRHVVGESLRDRGGTIVTPNIDICRKVHQSAAAASLVNSATLVVPDGMPLLWAARMRGTPFPARVTGSSLIFTLTEAAAAYGLSVYFLGGSPGVPEAAAANLSARFPGLKVAGTDSPVVGFDQSAAEVDDIRNRVIQAEPDIVYVGMGFPKQERLIAALAPALPATWFVGCGAAITFAAGAMPRAPFWMQRSGLEWTHRLLLEPQRLARRYLVEDLPFAVGLLLAAVLYRLQAARQH